MKFSVIPGLLDVKNKLLEGVKNNRIPHAQLFLTPSGANSLSLALAYTQYLYCQNRQENDSCGECSSCKKIEKNTHPDVHFSFPVIGAEQLSTQYMAEWRTALENHPNLTLQTWISYLTKEENKKVNITAHEARNIIKRLSYKPFEGVANTLIIWLPEFLGKEGNMLLKLIEEPPQKTYFILISENSEEILPTIKSRTQLIIIPKYTDSEIEQILTEKFGIQKDQAQKIAYLSDGNLKKAEELIENLSDDFSELFRTFLLGCYTNNLVEIAKISDDLAKMGRNQIILFLETGLKILREVLIYQQIPDYTIKYRDSYVDFIKKLSNVLNANFVDEIYQRMNTSIFHIGRNSYGKLTLFNLALEIRFYFIRNKK